MPWPLACESPVTARSSSVCGTDNLAFLPSVHLVGSGSVQSKVQALETLSAKGVGMSPGVPGAGRTSGPRPSSTTGDVFDLSPVVLGAPMIKIPPRWRKYRLMCEMDWLSGFGWSASLGDHVHCSGA